MNYVKGTKAQIPIRYYNKDRNREIKMGGFLSTATRFLDVCNVQNLTHRRSFGVDDLEFDRSKFTPIPIMKERVFASISGKIKGSTEEAGEADAAAAPAK